MSRRLMFFTDTEGIGGSEKYMVDLMVAMRVKGYAVSLLCHDHPSFICYVRQRTQGECRIIALRFPSVNRSRVLQAGLALNRSWKDRMSFLKIPGLLVYYFNSIKVDYILISS